MIKSRELIIPDGWKVKKISWLFNLIASGSTPPSNKDEYYNNKDIAWLNTGDLTDNYVESPSKFISNRALQDFSTLKVYPKESLIMAMYGATIGKLGITRFETTTNQACCVFAQPNEIDMKFMFYWLMGNREGIIQMSQGGGQPNISQGIIKSIRLAIPSLETQKRIVNFIDEKFHEINSVILDKVRLIQLLEEKRQSIITEAVTKGLNPNVKMKDSGVEWIGEIPEHWLSMRLKNAILLNPNKSQVDLNSNQKVTFLPMENIIEPGKIDVGLEKELSDVYSGYTYFKNEDIVMAKVTPCFENGNIAIANNLVNEVGFGTTELHVLRVREKQYNKFYYYLVQSEPFKQEGISMMYGVGGLKRIPTDFVSNYKFAAPPLDEQIEIANYLDSKCIQISNLKELINIEVEKLKAYRQSLIYEAVTGKIDVRDFEVEA
ncbi:restriction endonuclease [Bacillus cereus]|nr:restriction endonuclease [Bacillus cereus]PGU65184.1 restriction endonuclease [Bacillus cereus]